MAQLHPSFIVSSNVCRVDGVVDPYSHTESMHTFTQQNTIGVYAKRQPGIRISPFCKNISTFDASYNPKSRDVFRGEKILLHLWIEIDRYKNNCIV